MISAGTSTSGPMTHVNACPDAIPKIPIEVAIASSKLFQAAVNARAVFSS